MDAVAELDSDVMDRCDRHAQQADAEPAHFVPNQGHVALGTHALKVGRPQDAAAVEDLLDELDSAVPFVLLVDLLGSRVVARFGLLALIALDRAKILSPGVLTDASVVEHVDRRGGRSTSIGARHAAR